MVKLWCIFWKGILTACSGFPEPSNGSPCMKWFRLCQRIAHLCTRGLQITHYVQSKSRVVPHWNQEWPGVFCSAPQTAPEDWSGTLEMQEEVAVTSLRNPHWHLPPLKWFPKANEREEIKFSFYTEWVFFPFVWSPRCAQHTNNSFSSPQIKALQKTEAQGSQSTSLPSIVYPTVVQSRIWKCFYLYRTSNLEWSMFLPVSHRTQCCPWASRQLLHRSLPAWLWLHCHGAFSQGNLHKCPVKPQLSVLSVISSERNTAAPSAQGSAIPQECLHSPRAPAPDPHWCGAASGSACELPLGLSVWCCYLTRSPRRCRGNQHGKEKRTREQPRLN